MKKNIAILMGGFSSEHDISIKSGNVVYKHLDRSQFNVYRVVISKNNWYYWADDNGKHTINKDDFSFTKDNEKVTFDCVFNTVHGTPGEDGHMQGYFALLGIPQTSCNMYQSALTFNKRDTLSVLKPYGIKCADSYYLNKGDNIDLNAIVAKVGLPCFVKANRAGSSFGVTKVYKKEDIEKAVAIALKEDDEVLIESFLDGIEVSVGVINYGGQITVLPPTEIVSENDFFDYQAKYEGKSQEITPARISEAQTKAVSAEAEKIFRVLNMSGFTRSDFIFHNGEPHFIEMNTTPGLSEESILPQQALCAGISLADLFGNAITLALKK